MISMKFDGHKDEALLEGKYFARSMPLLAPTTVFVEMMWIYRFYFVGKVYYSTPLALVLSSQTYRRC